MTASARQLADGPMRRFRLRPLPRGHHDVEREGDLCVDHPLSRHRGRGATRDVFAVVHRRRASPPRSWPEGPGLPPGKPARQCGRARTQELIAGAVRAMRLAWISAWRSEFYIY